MKDKCRLVVLSLIRARLKANLPVYCNFGPLKNAKVIAVRINPAGYFEPLQVQIVGRSAWVTARDVYYYFDDNMLAQRQPVAGKGGAA